MKFVLPEGVGHEAALPNLQDAEGVTGIDVEDHSSGDAVAITLQIKPFRPRTLYASDKLYGYAGGLVPDHLGPFLSCDGFRMLTVARVETG